MKLICLMFLAVMSVVAVTECKPLGDDVEVEPCVDCEQKNLRRKRSFKMILEQAAKNLKLDLDCGGCEGSFSMTYKMVVTSDGSPDIYIGNGHNNENHAVINGARNVYIGNGGHNTNYVSLNS